MQVVPDPVTFRAELAAGIAVVELPHDLHGLLEDERPDEGVLGHVGFLDGLVVHVSHGSGKNLINAI